MDHNWTDGRQNNSSPGIPGNSGANAQPCSNNLLPLSRERPTNRVKIEWRAAGMRNSPGPKNRELRKLLTEPGPLTTANTGENRHDCLGRSPPEKHTTPYIQELYDTFLKIAYLANISLIYFLPVNVLHDDELETSPAGTPKSCLMWSSESGFRKRVTNHGHEQQRAVRSRSPAAPILSICRESNFPACSALNLPSINS